MTTVPEDLAFRSVFIGIFVAGLAISSYFRWRARKSGGVIPRRREGTLAMILRAAMALPLVAAILLYAFFPRLLYWSAVPLPTWVRWLGAGLGVTCLPLLWWVFRSIGANISETVLTKTGHKLVTVGPYRWVRHPLYAVALLEILRPQHDRWQRAHGAPVAHRSLGVSVHRHPDRGNEPDRRLPRRVRALPGGNRSPDAAVLIEQPYAGRWLPNLQPS